MSAPSSLIQAALQRLGARIGSGLLDAVASLAVLAQDAPDKLRQELQLFWEEVEAEADRIDRGDTAPAGEWTSPGQGPISETASGHGGPDSSASEPYPAHSPQAGGQPVATMADPQRQIDNLRALIASLARRLDQQLDQQRMDQQRPDQQRPDQQRLDQR
jgi:hypothetical protein